MNHLLKEDLLFYVEQNISTFHQKRLEKLDSLKLNDVLRRKNPYLFKAKNILKSQELVEAIVDAFLSSSEEGLFGDWLEGLAIFINQKVYNGRKSGIPGIDLEFDTDNTRHIVSIKSGPNWGNSSQIRKLVDNFNSARKVLRTSGAQINITAVNGCCYGKTTTKNKYKPEGDYYKYCGQAFWEYISGNPDLYISIIEPLGHQAKNKNDKFDRSYAKKINLFTREFTTDFCDKDGEINWEKLVAFNSEQS